MKRGFATLEIMMAMVIITMTLGAVASIVFTNQGALIGGQTNSEALNLAEGALEEQQALARKDFNLVNAATSTEGLYTTAVAVLQQADLFSKKITATVRWLDQRRIERNVSLTAVVANFENTGSGDTCNSSLPGEWPLTVAQTSFDFGQLVGDVAGTYSVSDLDAFGHRLYVAAGSTSGASDPTLFVFAISPSDPPTLTLIGKADNAPVAKGVSALRIASSTDNQKLYAYLANANDANFNTCTQSASCSQLQIADVSAPALSAWNPVLSSLKLATGTVPFVNGNISSSNSQAVGSSLLYKNGYVFLGLTTTAKGSGLHIIDVHNPSGPVWVASWPAAYGGAGPSWGPVNALAIKGSYVYAAVAPTTTPLDAAKKELLTLDIASDFTKPALVGGFGSASGLGSGKSLALVGSTIYLGRDVPNAAPELHVLNNSAPKTASLPELANAEINSTVSGITVRDSLAFLLDKTNLQVVHATSALPYASVPLAASGGTEEPSLDCEGNYLYVASNNSANKGTISIFSVTKP